MPTWPLEKIWLHEFDVTSVIYSIIFAQNTFLIVQKICFKATSLIIYINWIYMIRFNFLLYLWRYMEIFYILDKSFIREFWICSLLGKINFLEFQKNWNKNKWNRIVNFVMVCNSVRTSISNKLKAGKNNSNTIKLIKVAIKINSLRLIWYPQISYVKIRHPPFQLLPHPTTNLNKLKSTLPEDAFTQI